MTPYSQIAEEVTVRELNSDRMRNLRPPDYAYTKDEVREICLNACLNYFQVSGAIEGYIKGFELGYARGRMQTEIENPHRYKDGYHDR